MKNKRKITIDLVENDPVDVRCGGPRWLGFDFVIENNQTPEQIRKWLGNVIKNKKFPCERIFISRPCAFEGKVWTKEEVEKEINSYSIA